MRARAEHRYTGGFIDITEEAQARDEMMTKQSEMPDHGLTGLPVGKKKPPDSKYRVRHKLRILCAYVSHGPSALLLPFGIILYIAPLQLNFSHQAFSLFFSWPLQISLLPGVYI